MTLGKRKRSPTTLRKESLKPTTKKIIVDPEYKQISEYAMRRIKKNIPSDVNLTRIYATSISEEFFTRQLKNVLNSEKVAMLIGVFNYLPGTKDINHAIAAYKVGNILYCFDPWGIQRKDKSQRIFKILKKIYNPRYFLVYEGSNLQTKNTRGACVGLSSNFIIKMANRKSPIKQGFRTYVKKEFKSVSTSKICNNLNTKAIAISKKSKSKSKSKSQSRSLTPMNIG